MSDLASPLLYVLCDEVEAFWCFVALMERIGPHFDDCQSGVQAQLKALGTLLQVGRQHTGPRGGIARTGMGEGSCKGC